MLRDELLQSRVRHLHLGLHADGAQHHERLYGPVDDAVQQGRLADTGFAEHGQRAAPAVVEVIDQRLEGPALPLTAPEHPDGLPFPL
jgi:hypothetical protein